MHLAITVALNLLENFTAITVCMFCSCIVPENFSTLEYLVLLEFLVSLPLYVPANYQEGQIC